MTFHVDLGQVIIAVLIAVMGYLLKFEVSSFKEKLDKHDNLIFRLVADVQRLIGRQEYWDGVNRRSSSDGNIRKN